MKSIELILLGLFLVAILLMARAGAQNTATTRLLETAERSCSLQ